MEFLRKLVYDRPSFTNTFIDFDCVGPLPEDDVENEIGEEVEDVEIECDMDNIISATVPASPSSQSVCSTMSASSSSSLSGKLTCGICAMRQKDALLQCGHSVCMLCFEQMKRERKAECSKIRGKKRERSKKKNFSVLFQYAVWQ